MDESFQACSIHLEASPQALLIHAVASFHAPSTHAVVSSQAPSAQVDTSSYVSVKKEPIESKKPPVFCFSSPREKETEENVRITARKNAVNLFTDNPSNTGVVWQCSYCYE
ncbi:MAG: hypothetical protein MJ142_04755 [Clostridia bacterium]|nr:hypothetical protein [Clostridia bacterium]